VLTAPRLIEAIWATGKSELGYRRAELSWVAETNGPMRRLLETLGCQPCKIYRIYEKTLDVAAGREPASSSS
jgi:hypothetical protein